MSTANAIVPHTQQNTQNTTPLLEGVDLGIYTFRIDGEGVRVYGRDYLDALREAHRLLNENKTGEPQVDWMPCPHCGFVLDLDEDYCPSCGSVTVFASGIEWEVSQ